MDVRGIGKVIAAILICAAILSAAVLWNELPGSPVDCSEDEPSSSGADDSVQPYAIVHCVRVVPIAERVTKIVVSLAAIIGLAYITNVSARSAKPWAAACFSAVSTTIALAVLGYVYGRTFERWLFPDPPMLLAICTATGALGAAASWALSRWWPNTSFERTREG
jgi:hypothetical protein